MRDFERLSHEADMAGFRLEVVHGIPIWEAFPVFRHQSAIDRIRHTIQPTAIGEPCRCIHAADVQIRFPDGSRKRPDISIFCRTPDEMDSEITLVPEAVIEVLSKDYEAKDLVIGVPFYQQVGIRDIVVLDPENDKVTHWQQGAGEKTYKSPAPLVFLCGCSCVV